MIERAERARILAGDTSPLIRAEEPELTEGQRIVLARSRESRSADPQTGRVIVTPPLELFAITVNRIRRRAAGDWSVRFDVEDYRESVRLVRRKPPALREGDYREPSAAEIERAALDSAYTSNPRAALDHLEAVDAVSQRRITRQAHDERMAELGEMLAAIEDMRAALRTRIETHPRFEQIAGREIWRLRSEMDRLVAKIRSRSAA